MATAGPEVSLQNLIDKFHLSQDQLDQEVSEEHLRKVSRIIDDHVVVGYELGLSESDMAAINHDERTQERQRTAMLRKWKRKVSWKATYGKLIEALLECDRADHAREVCELLSQSEKVNKSLQSQLQQEEREVKNLRSHLQQKKIEIQEMASENRDIQREKESLRKEAQCLRSQLLQKEREIENLKSRLQRKEREIQERAPEKRREFRGIQRENVSYRQLLQNVREAFGHSQNELPRTSGPPDYYDILLLGRTGYGKSTTGNKLLEINREMLGVLDRLWADYFGTSSEHQECKVLSNKHKTRVMDTRGFADLELTKQLGALQANRPLFQEILQGKKKHSLTFRRALYFLPIRGPLECADGNLQDEIKVMYELLGMDIFNIMVIIATQKKWRKYQVIGYDEEDIKQTKGVFTFAFERTTGQHLPKCPPILYLPLDETDVMNKVVAAKVISDLPHKRPHPMAH